MALYSGEGSRLPMLRKKAVDFTRQNAEPIFTRKLNMAQFYGAEPMAQFFGAEPIFTRKLNMAQFYGQTFVSRTCSWSM